jgi:hypothetical protein
MILEYKIKRTADHIFTYLTDTEKFVSVHPVIYKMDSLNDGSFKVYETLKFFFIPCSFTYSASIHGNLEDRTVYIKAVVMKMTEIEMIFKLTPGNEYTRVHETVNFKSPLPVKGIMTSIFKKQHKQLFSNIESAQ